MINFNEPILIEAAFTYVREAICNKKLSEDGEYSLQPRVHMRQKWQQYLQRLSRVMR